ncbi:MAG: amidophosphoribosyltransferase [Gammaproteobacteria bacterium HGW-Gammaproteobacteria-1]|jgi:ComF family protein|nr:MAG: amidophosphoribosyltransferase [Gammaproteobacteria bacterium HGW-Gammaproteobacteria-1]
MKRIHLVDDCINYVQSLLYPPTCLLCGAPGADGLDLCPGCLRSLPWNTACCVRCAAPLPAAGLCGQCLKRPPSFDAALTPLLYRPPLDWLLQGYKFNRRLPPGRVLAELLRRHLLRHVDTLPDLILPVPLHPARLRERGYNQALELARPLARALDIPLAAGLARRIRATATQSLLPAEERRRNVRGAFELAGPLRARHVAIVDDVIATGSTVGELARLLRRAGAERVEVWAVARAGRS